MKQLFIKFKKYWKEFFIIIFLVLLLFNRLTWLIMITLLLIGLYRGLIFCIGYIKVLGPIHKLARASIFFIIVFISSISLKVLLIDFYRIPSISMEGTLYPEDVILVNKLAYGPKLPQSPFEIPWMKFIINLKNNSRENMDKNSWPYKRLNGYSFIEQGNILVYELEGIATVKRCVALAGDTISIVKGRIMLNGIEYNEPIAIKNMYHIRVKNRKKFYRTLDSLKIKTPIYQEGDDSNNLKTTLSHKEKYLLKDIPEVITMEKELDTFNIKREFFTVSHEKLGWTLDEMGPFIVPKKGMRITINPHSFNIYKYALEKHENLALVEKEGNYYDEFGNVVLSHTFSKDYYFLMGDNRKYSIDSRYSGFVPEQRIIGKVQSVLFSNYFGKFRWNRILRNVRGLENN